MAKCISRIVLFGLSLTLILSAALQQGVAAQSGDIGVTFVRDTHTVTFMMNNGTNANHAIVDYVYSGLSISTSTNAQMPLDPSRLGFTFAGWNSLPNGLGSVFTDTTIVTGNITVFARWTENLPNTYTVTFRMNDGAGLNHAIVPNIVSGGTVGAQMPATPSRQGFLFAGWNTQANGSAAAFTASTQITGNIGVYAQWVQLQHTVQFVDWNGWPISSQQVPHGSSAIAPPNPYRSGYVFMGWNHLFNIVTDDMTVTAVYQIIFIGGGTPTPNPTPILTPNPTPEPTPPVEPPPGNEEIEPETPPLVTEDPEPGHPPIDSEGPGSETPSNETSPGYGSSNNPNAGTTPVTGYNQPEPGSGSTPVLPGQDPIGGSGSTGPGTSNLPGGNGTGAGTGTGPGYVNNGENPAGGIVEPTEDDREQPRSGGETNNGQRTPVETTDEVPAIDAEPMHYNTVFLNSNIPPSSFANVPSLSFGDRGVLLFAPMGVQAWSLLNLLISILGFMLFVVVTAHALIKKKREQDQVIDINSPDDIVGVLTEIEGKAHKHYRVLWLAVMGIMGMLGVFLFVLTQDMNRMMVLLDLGTIAHAFIFAIGVVAAALAYRRITVKFETNGGSKVLKQKVGSGNKLLEPDAPSRQGYTFAGWYTDESLFDVWNYNNKVEKSFKLYARWVVDDKPVNGS